MRRSISHKIREKLQGKTLNLPSGLGITLPTSEKNFIGTLPIGSYIDVQPEDNLIVGIYWKGEDGARDLDLSFTDIDGNTVDSLETITSKYVVVSDMIVGTLLQQVRDLGIAGRELSNFVDLADTDGPLQAIRDTMFLALTEAKKARIVKSQNFRELGAGVKKNYLKRTLTQEMADTRESIQTILDIADGEDSDELLMALFEAFSSMQTVNKSKI